LNYAESLVLDDGHGDHQGTVRVPSPTFYHFPWLADLVAEDPSPGWEPWAQLELDVPDDVAAARESRRPEGGNSTWHLPLDLVARLAKEQADAGASSSIQEGRVREGGVGGGEGAGEEAGEET
jgi:hypothetical protein